MGEGPQEVSLPPTPQRGHATVVDSIADALAPVGDGMTIGIGGALNSGHPMALVRGLIQKQPRDLTIVAGFGSCNLDMIVGAGLAKRLVAAFVGIEGVNGLPPLIRWATEEGGLESWDVDEGILLVALRAAAQRLPYATSRAAMGTDAARSPLIEACTDAADGIPYLKVKPLPLDVSLYWAEAADSDGNVLRWGPDFGDTALIEASRTRIVQVERIVPTSMLRRDVERVAPWQADIVVSAPLGTYPFASTLLQDDLRWLQDYMTEMEKLRRVGDAQALRAALSEILCLDGDDDAFLAKAGVARLRELMR